MFNEKTGFVLVCPITKKDNKFPLHIALPENVLTGGFVLTEHVRAIDFEARGGSFVEKVSSVFLVDVIGILEGFYYS